MFKAATYGARVDTSECWFYFQHLCPLSHCDTCKAILGETSIALRFQKQIRQNITSKYSANLALAKKIKIQFQTAASIYTESGSGRVRQIQIPLGGSDTLLFHVLQWGFQRATRYIFRALERIQKICRRIVFTWRSSCSLNLLSSIFSPGQFIKVLRYRFLYFL